MHISANQKRTFLHLLAQLRPSWHRDPALPARIQSLLAARREFGSRDRRLYRELIYTTVRHLPWIEPWLDRAPDEAVRRVAWLAAETPATKMFRSEFATGESPTGDRTELLPGWFRDHCDAVFSGAELDAQLQRPPLWLRCQTSDPSKVMAEFSSLGWKVRISAVLTGALEVLGDVDVTKTEAWQTGAVEVQDLGSQLLLETLGIEPGGRWLDACAGAGGKSLQLARLLGPGATLTAHDVRPAALAELRARAMRGGFKNIQTSTELSPETYEGVLVDAPCSGSGTWRRSPHLKWVTTPATIAERAALQLTLLERFAPRVRPGGRMIYATCSLSRMENEEVIAAFLASHPEFSVRPPARTFGFTLGASGLTILPARHNTDGYFVSTLRRG